MTPDTRFVTTGGVTIAYQVLGDGPIDLVLVPGWLSHIEVFWEDASVARFFRKLATFTRLILFDKRGTGLSDRITEAATLEERMDDVRAVMDAVGSSRAALFGYSEGAAMCALFAATYPERAVALITIGGFPRRIRGPDYPWGPDREQMFKSFDVMAAEWGGPVGMEVRMASVAAEPIHRQWWSKFLRQSANLSSAIALSKANVDIDIRHILPSIRVPTLILHASNDGLIPIEVARYMAAQIPNAKFAEIDSIDHVPFFHAADMVLEEMHRFLLGVPAASMVDSAVATLMFTDIVGSTRMAIEKGDQGYADILEAHHAAVRRELSLHRGHEIETTGDGFLASFDGPARSIRCAVGITRALKTIGITARVGLHTGECEVRDGRLRGIALNIAARVSGLAPPGGVLVSQTVRDLVAGSGLRFVDRGAHTLKGLPEEWRLFEVDTASAGQDKSF
jgi:pimeloyl-ACP methyl ester carboxylesterase/class 3 adenylate cyclase